MMPTKANDNTLGMVQGFWKRMNRKIQDKPMPMQILQKRSMNTATTILVNLQDVPFNKLTLSLYLYCQDKSMSEFTHHYEAQLELAGANPERFFMNLHKFYQDMSHKIKKENLYRDFFEFLCFCTETRLTLEQDKVEIAVINSYINLLMQNLEYLRPDKFDFTVAIAGLTTTGEVITIPDTYPLLDQPGYEIEDAARDNKITGPASIQRIIKTAYEKYGFKGVDSIEKLEELTNIDKLFTNNLSAMLPYINEFTTDILPTADKPFNTDGLPFFTLKTTLDYNDLQQTLHRRKRTLPPNGYTVEFTEDTALFHSLLFKEIHYKDSIVMLYKLDTTQGILSGYYNTKTEFFYNIFWDFDDKSIYNNLKTLVLFLYASGVCQTTQYSIDKLKDCFYLGGEGIPKRLPINATAYGIGGKLRSVYNSRPDAGHARIGDDKYTTDTAAVQGFIRKVGEGRTPSADAIAYAESLGYFLEPDETYVRPFIKQVYKLRNRE